jgi:hypothetical protein
VQPVLDDGRLVGGVHGHLLARLPQAVIILHLMGLLAVFGNVEPVEPVLLAGMGLRTVNVNYSPITLAEQILHRLIPPALIAVIVVPE